MTYLTPLEAQAAAFIAGRNKQIPEELLIDAAEVPHNPSKLYRTSGRLSEREIAIVETDATGLAEAIAAATYTAVEVTEAFIKSAVIAHSGTNCLAWFDVDLAREQAAALDAEFKRTGKTVGPLHGVPMSVKDFMHVRGFTQSSGHISSAGLKPTKDAEMVDIFRKAGAVFYAKTTQPQSIMHLETSNFLGVTNCSHNRALTCGGSSGGEGALVGCRGSPMGITTDVGGSTRNPAANNGLYGFKPTTKRVPRDGIIGVTSHSRIAGAIGPVCHSLRDIDLFMRVLFITRSWAHDIKLVPLGWRDVNANGKGAGFDGWSGAGNKLRVGVMLDDGHVRPVQPIKRAMEAMVGKLNNFDRVEVEYIPGKWFDESWKITLALYYVDGGKRLREALGEEKMVPLTEYIVSKARDLSREEIDDLVGRRNEIRQAYFDYFNSLNLDVILSPTGPAPAQPLGTTKYWSYTSMWNMLDWPAAVFPTGLFVGAEDDVPHPEPRNVEEKHLYETYSAKVAAESPICLQLIAPRWQDERVLAALGVLVEVLPLSK